MTKAKMVMCECNGRGDQVSTLQSLEQEASLNLAVTSGACRHGLAHLAELDQEVIVGCTQEQAVFEATSVDRTFPLQFVNLRDVQRAQPRSTQLKAAIAARAAFVQNYSADGVPSVIYQSAGRLAILADEHTHTAVIEQAASTLQIDVLVNDASSISLDSKRRVNAMAAKALSVTGHLGAFEIACAQSNPVDMELCTRCGACVDACPSQSISKDNFSINLETCDQNRACVKACGEFKAIRFDALQTTQVREYDLVIDLRAQSAFEDRQAPLGYWHAGQSAEGLTLALLEAMQTVGEFEKPKFFQYKSKVCAHSRSKMEGCNACIETCSTQAIVGKGNGIEVDPHLCLGCGACASVCPTGAIQYGFEPAQSMLRATKSALQAFRQAGGANAQLLVHSSELSGQWMEQTFGQKQSEFSLVPVPVHHAASVGPDYWLAALAYGASAVSVVLEPQEYDFYGAALQSQASWVNTVLVALGLSERVRVVCLNSANDLIELTVPQASWPAATFDASVDKRTRMHLALAHLAKDHVLEAPIPLPQSAPFGAVVVDTEKCTLCMSCTSACPASALVDNPEMPQLRFIESNCVQCGLCKQTCPEAAISLVPQLNLSPAAKEKRVLNESQPFHCTSCGKAFGTKHMIENMLSKLSGHSMFEANSKRLTMCADCRVQDMFQDKNEMTIHEVKR